mgnify:FL=1
MKGAPLTQANTAAASSKSDVKRSPKAIGGKYHFLLRRLHSLSGVVPVGVFVIFHLFTNMQMLFTSPGDPHGGAFQHEVEFIHSLPALLVIEIVLWVSIGFHAALGIAYTVVGAKPNANKYGYFDNWRYSLQRISGILALVFIFFHIATLRWRWDVFGWFTPFYVEGTDGQPLAAATTAMALQHAWWVVALYVVGVLSVIYHWSNGLWTAAITWGLTISQKAQNRWKGVCAALGIALTVFFGGALIGSLQYELTPAEKASIERTNAARQADADEANAPGSGQGSAGASDAPAASPGDLPRLEDHEDDVELYAE